MKFFAIVFALVLALTAAEVELPPIFQDYHEEIGIPAAARIRRAEESMDFDGSRITGGQASALGSQPFLGGLLITLINNRQSVCGSSLVTNKRLVTAAHCWKHGVHQGRELVIVLGSVRLFFGGTHYVTDEVEMHAAYNQTNLNYDIAIIKTSYIAFTVYIKPIKIPTGNNQYVGCWATASGFGLNSDNSPISLRQSKHEVKLQVVTNALCKRTYTAAVVVASTICVATPNGRSTCSGDSGGPLALGSGDNRELIGVTSFGHREGCERGHPAGFVRVTSLADWIRQRI